MTLTGNGERKLTPTWGAEVTNGAHTERRTPTVDLRVALFTASQDEPSFLAWTSLLEADLVPYDVVVVGDDRLTDARLQHSADHGRYQAFILTTDTLLRQQGAAFLSALDADEWSLLHAYQRTFGVRKVSAYATPAPSHGLTSPTSAGDVGGTTASLTAAGHAVFPQLRGPVPLSVGTYGFVTRPVDGANFETFVAGADGTPIVGVISHDDGREEMVVTVASGPHSEHMHLLGHGMLNWVTGGDHLGCRKYFLSIHVDDVLMSAESPSLTGDGTSTTVRMQPEDVDDVATWSAKAGVRFDLTYNGWGAVSREGSGSTDPLADTLRDNAAKFGWINHTFGHRDLDHARYEEIHSEIADNLAWAKENDIPVETDSLVTGAHSGLRNPEVGRALDATGVRWIASDASRPDQADASALGKACAVPRHPVNIPLTVTTASELQTLRPAPLDTNQPVSEQKELLHQTEARLMLGHILGNDPRPHFAHQNALTGERLMLDLLDVTLASYRQVLTAPLTRPTLAEAGEELRRREQWRELVLGGGLEATLSDEGLQITNLTQEPIQVPVTAKNRESDEDSCWVTIEPGAVLAA